MATRRYSDGYRAKRQVDAARRVAFEVLSQVTADDAYANIVLPKALRRIRAQERFDARDAAFASELVHGTLRARGRLDWVIARHLTRPIDDTDPVVLDLLRMGAHQLLDMRVPDHAAVSTTVDLAREHLTDGPARMVNAVLRAIAREEPGAIDAAIDAIDDPVERLAVKTSHPEWMVRAFEDALVAHGYDADELEDLLDADNEPPIVTLVARPTLIEPADLADEAEEVLGTRVAPGSVSEYAVLLESGDPALLPSLRDGRAAVQDEGSQLAAVIAAKAPVDGPDQRWLDLCAGPGGKAALVASLGVDRGARLVANEVHPHRARLVERTTRHLDNVEVVSGDGRTFGGPGTSWPLASFDRVVVDAPCSGMGSMRRRPESRWRRNEDDLVDLVDLQRGLLRRARDLTRPGGLLVYITCSPHRAETRDRVEHLLAEGGLDLVDAVSLADRFAPEPLVPPASAGVVDGGGAGRTLQLWDHRYGTDLMFVAVFTKG